MKNALILKAVQPYLPSIITINKLGVGSNNVWKLTDLNNKEYLFKEYINRGSHNDSEPMLYKLLNSPDFFRKQIKIDLSAKNFPEKFGIFEYASGNLLYDIICNKKLGDYNITNIVGQVIKMIQYFSANSPTELNFGQINLEENMVGNSDSWIEFLTKYHQTSIDKIAIKNPQLASKGLLISEKILSLLSSDKVVPVIIPCDLNTKNLLVINDNKLLLLSGSIMVGDEYYGYSQFLAHLYKTPLGDEMIKQLTPNEYQLSKLHLYCSISNYNVMAFISEYTSLDLESETPWGNALSFSSLIGEHISKLDMHYD